MYSKIFIIITNKNYIIFSKFKFKYNPNIIGLLINIYVYYLKNLPV